MENQKPQDKPESEATLPAPTGSAERSVGERIAFCLETVFRLGCVLLGAGMVIYGITCAIKWTISKL